LLPASTQPYLAMMAQRGWVPARQLNWPQGR
jgi:hypothetical protein